MNQRMYDAKDDNDNFDHGRTGAARPALRSVAKAEVGRA